MIGIFDSLPDAVLLARKSESIKTVINDTESIRIGEVGATHFDTMYCNQQTDNLFQSQLSKLSNE
jgi:hypothetical protein